jgi:hypothetical protein
VDISGFSFQSAGAQGQKPKSGTFTVEAVSPRLLLNGNDVTGQTVNVVVGQPINLSVQIDGATVETATWQVPGSATVYSANMPSYSPNLALAAPPAFYWVDGAASRKITVNATLAGGSTASASAYFNVVALNAALVTVNALGTPGVQANVGGPFCTTSSGTQYWCGQYGTGTPAGISFYIGSGNGSLNPGNFEGNYAWIQLASVSLYKAPVGTSGTSVSCPASVDTEFTYSSLPWASSTDSSASDTPGNELRPTYSDYARSDAFVMTLLFMPIGYKDADGVLNYITGGILVPVAQVLWNWKYNATSSDGGASWVLDGTQFANTPSAGGTTQYPTWSDSGSIQSCVPSNW